MSDTRTHLAWARSALSQANGQRGADRTNMLLESIAASLLVIAEKEVERE
jgi:hypothetical protein